jgi:nicotinate-nucleotide adenylyltransferase
LPRLGIKAQLPDVLRQAVGPWRMDSADELGHLPSGKITELAVTPLEIFATHVRKLPAARDPQTLYRS